MNVNKPILDMPSYSEEGVITAENALRNVDKLPPHINLAVILFDKELSEEIIEKSTLLFPFVAAASIVPQYIYDNKIVLANSPLGGPAAGGLIEELIAFGVERFLACGSSGLIGSFDASHFLLVTKAIRDEGLSYHYLEPSLYVETSQSFTKQVERELLNHHLAFEEGIVWTTDAFYRETPSKIELRKSQGAIAVEMECASMAAVCQYRGKEFAQVLYFSDIVKQEEWSGFRDDRKQIKSLIQNVIVEIACRLSEQ